MSGLINLISEFSSSLFILPILVLMNVIITIIIYFINNRKILKYLPSIIIGLVSILVGIYSIAIFTSPMGLNTAWIAIFLMTTAVVGIATGFIIDLFISIRSNLGLNNEIVKESISKQKQFKARRRRDKDNLND